MHTTQARLRAGAQALAATALIVLLTLLAGCSSSGSASSATSKGASAAQSVVAENSAAINAAETLLLANLQKEIKDSPTHPYLAAKAAIKDTFPTGNVARIEQYGVQEFKLTMLHSQSARHDWIHKVVTFALANGGSTASPGSAVIPGTTAQPASPSTTGSTP